MTQDQPATPRRERVFLVVVDESPEQRVALRYASLRARNTGGRMSLLVVVEPADRQHWMALESLMRDEQRQEAEQLAERAAAEVSAITGTLPTVHIREGALREELLALIDEDRTISILVLAASATDTDPGPLVSALASKYLGRLRVPMTVVPGRLSDAEIAALA
jgi:nucleotide-binding universal stress UspA family protein